MREPEKIPAPEVEFERVDGDAAADDRPRGVSRGVLIAALAAVTAIALGLAVALYVDRRQSTLEEEGARAVEAYTTAWTAHDLAGIEESMAPGASFSAGENLANPLISRQVGAQLGAFLPPMFDANVSLETMGEFELVANGRDSARLSVPQRFRYTVYGLAVVEDGLSLYSLVRVGGTIKVAQHVWWRPQSPRYPSMLWAGCSALETTCE